MMTKPPAAPPDLAEALTALGLVEDETLGRQEGDLAFMAQTHPEAMVARFHNRFGRPPTCFRVDKHQVYIR
jgi:hypothetical protein